MKSANLRSLVVKFGLSLVINLFLTFQANAQKPLIVNNALPFSTGLVSTHIPIALESNSQAMTANFMLASYADMEIEGQEALILDGESHHVQINYSKTISLFGRPSTLQIEGGYTQHSAGSLDSLIDQWHDFFGLPEGDRPAMPRDRLLYQYSNGQKTNKMFAKSTGGMTDTLVQFSIPIGNGASGNRYQAYLALDLPTGDSKKLTGSDKLDVSAGIAGQWKLSARWGTSVNVAYTYKGSEQQFGIETKNSGWMLSSAVDFRLTKTWLMLASVQTHSAVFKSELKALGDTSAQLNLGLRKSLTFGDGVKNSIDIYFSEDLAVNRSADFAIGVRWNADF